MTLQIETPTIYEVRAIYISLALFSIIRSRLLPEIGEEQSDDSLSPKEKILLLLIKRNLPQNNAKHRFCLRSSRKMPEISPLPKGWNSHAKA